MLEELGSILVCGGSIALSPTPGWTSGASHGREGLHTALLLEGGKASNQSSLVVLPNLALPHEPDSSCPYNLFCLSPTRHCQPSEQVRSQNWEQVQRCEFKSACPRHLLVEGECANVYCVHGWVPMSCRTITPFTEHMKSELNHPKSMLDSTDPPVFSLAVGPQPAH